MKRLFLLIIAALLMTAQQAWADYVTDIMVIGHDSKRQVGYLYDNYKGAGWKCIDWDLNDDAGGHYIYLVYKTNTCPQNSGTPITDLYLWSKDYAGPASLVHNGRTYYRVGADGDATFIGHQGDLNCNAGGNWIQLYYTKDQYKPYRYVFDISVDKVWRGCLGENAGSTPGDLNRGAGGNDIFLHVNADYDNWAENRAASFSHVDGNTITIMNEAEFALMAYNVNHVTDYEGTTFVLGTDLDLTAHYWTPIGGPDNHYFRGNFDGKGHTISGVYIYKPDDDYLGLFGFVQGDTRGNLQPGCDYIKNFVLKDTHIQGRNYIGGISGFLINGMTLENVFCQADVAGLTCVGAFAGHMRGDMHVKNCLFISGNIIGDAIFGTFNNEVSLSNCYYIDPASNVGNGADVLAYPVTTSLPEGVTASYEPGITYEGINYSPKGTVNLVVKHNFANTVTVKVNGTEVLPSEGFYPFTIDPATTKNYEVTVTLDDMDIAGDGSQDNPYLIAKKADWDYMVNFLDGGLSLNNFAGVHFLLAADNITVNQRMGTNDHPFCGTFDGGGHTLTLDFGSSEKYSDQECAPFYRLNNATIKNLVVEGSIYSSAQKNAGLAVRATGKNNCIQNCVSRVSIHSDKNGDCTSGGFIGIINVDETCVYFKGCAFTGEFIGENTSNWGGFVGWREYYYKNYRDYNRNYVYFTDCLFAPTTVNIATPDGSNSRTFCRSRNNTTDGANYSDCYFMTTLQVADGGHLSNTTATEPTGIGEEGTNYGMIVAYANGLKYDGHYYMDEAGISMADNADNSTLIRENDGRFTNVTLSDRALYKDNKWNTICLPFDVTLKDSPLKGAEARTLNEATLNDGTLTLNFSNPVETLTAGTPYLIRWDKTTDANIIIHNAQMWDIYTQMVNGGLNFNVVMLVADIEVETMMGTSDHPFCGTFDGGGHTLTFKATATETYCAPFHYVEDATIKNLHITGTITTSQQASAGLVGHSKGTTTIENCWSSVNINSSVSGDGAHGGIVACTQENASNITLNNCLFDGSIAGENTYGCGGLIGWNNDKAKLTNCVFRPTSITQASSENNATFSRGNNATFTNCYYSKELPGASGQGTAIGEMTNEALLAALGNNWQVNKSEVVPNIVYVTYILSPTFYNATITATEPIDITPGLNAGTEGDCSVTFMGTYDPVEIGEGGDRTKLYFSDNNTLYWPNGAMTINPFRAYLQLNGASAAATRSIVLNFGEGTTAIEVVDSGELTVDIDESWYTISGVKLDGKPSTKGVYIHKGRKVMIK